MALEGFTDTTGTEFGEVDNPTYGGYTEPGWNKGAFGDSLTGWDNQGFALPTRVLKPYGYGTKDFASNFNQNYEIQAYSPDTGKVVTGPLKDIGPAPGAKAGIDMLGGSRSALGLERNFSGSIQYRIVPKGTPTPEAASLASAQPVDTTGTAAVAPTAVAPTAVGADTVTQQRMKILQAAMGLTPGAATGATPQASTDTGYAGLNLAGLGGGGGTGVNWGLIDAIRRNRAAQALRTQQAIQGGSQLGGQLTQGAGKLYGQLTNLNPVWSPDWANQQAQAAGYANYAAMQQAGAV